MENIPRRCRASPRPESTKGLDQDKREQVTPVGKAAKLKMLEPWVTSKSRYWTSLKSNSRPSRGDASLPFSSAQQCSSYLSPLSPRISSALLVGSPSQYSFTPNRPGVL